MQGVHRGNTSFWNLYESNSILTASPFYFAVAGKVDKNCLTYRFSFAVLDKTHFLFPLWKRWRKSFHFFGEKMPHIRKLTAYLHSLGGVRKLNTFRKNKMKKNTITTARFLFETYLMWIFNKEEQFYFIFLGSGWNFKTMKWIRYFWEK